jgi:hypothetical protein
VWTDLSLAWRAARWGARLILTAISAVLYALSFAVAITIRAGYVTLAWLVAALALGWEDAWPRRAPRDAVERTMEATPTSYAPTPAVLRREQARTIKLRKRG